MHPIEFLQPGVDVGRVLARTYSPVPVLPTSGAAKLAGIDVAPEPVAARAQMSVVLAQANVYADLTGWQNVMLMAEFHAVRRMRRPEERGAELIDLFGLTGRERHKRSDLSKGLRQRLMLCMGVVADPEILFLIRAGLGGSPYFPAGASVADLLAFGLGSKSR